MKLKIEEKSNRLSNKKTILYSILVGVLSGFINGIFGGGGGMIVVPMLNLILKYDEKIAHATAILIILPISIISSLFYAAFGNFDLKIGIPTGIGVTVGGIVGALLLSKLKAKWVSIIFSFVMLAAGVKMLFF
ncbi:MAG: sulfite exporter TauE/SafE family protein [Clostridiales bacterium]|nr:sulfite exporter TauE/SafE family protein [Clostridiales bacterium]